MPDGRQNGASAKNGLFSSLLFLTIFCYFWIGLAPFPDPNAAALLTAYGKSSNLINQLIVVSLSGVVLVTMFRYRSAGMLLRPHGLLAVLLVWVCFTGLLSDDPATAFRRIVFAVLVCLCSSAVLLLPRNEQQFGKLVCGIMVAVICLSYFGVIALPQRAIHQPTDALEQLLAGDWRGHFGHKNVAAGAMVFAVFFGLYLRQVRSTMIGLLIVAAAGFFVLKSGGKTSAGMLPAVLVLAWVFEHVRASRWLIPIVGLLVVNAILMSAAVSPAVSGFLLSLGVDPTFTDRSSIWELALSAIADRPLFGYGFQSFWQTEALFSRGQALSSWAVTAANSHNGYVEQLINGGIPMLILVVAWLVLLPIRDASRALKSGKDKALTRLFIRIWLFSLFFACLESPFFGNTGPLWFTTLISVFGLRFQAYASLVEAKQVAAAKVRPARVNWQRPQRQTQGLAQGLTQRLANVR
ncbi:O-antigen ligase [Rhizobium sp. CECT 9324]|uniref:O-antigen ligase family protein n=1 Tax=Rhizobium sp. CECT 9324 TaxID=2845820 RepID=UPI001E574F39|nr:O-antigen ligase [Rhizobium sp. CECT 9324]CAH0339081.1 hypothetical protein RHI9324_00721 [Rhizobium sp. CECT 9324]